MFHSWKLTLQGSGQEIRPQVLDRVKRPISEPRAEIASGSLRGPASVHLLKQWLLGWSCLVSSDFLGKSLGIRWTFSFQNPAFSTDTMKQRCKCNIYSREVCLWAEVHPNPTELRTWETATDPSSISRLVHSCDLSPFVLRFRSYHPTLFLWG